MSFHFSRNQIVLLGLSVVLLLVGLVIPIVQVGVVVPTELPPVGPTPAKYPTPEPSPSTSKGLPSPSPYSTAAIRFPSPSPSVRVIEPMNSPNQPNGWNLVSTLSLVASGGTFLGFISNSILGWKKERRDKQASRLDQELKAIQLERERFEFEEMKRKQGPAKSREP